MILIKGRSRRLTGGYPRTTFPVRGCATRMATMEAFDTVLNWKLQRGGRDTRDPLPPDLGTDLWVQLSHQSSPSTLLSRRPLSATVM
jgi:hypothetical protein